MFEKSLAMRISGLIRAAALNCAARKDFILRILEDGRSPALLALFMKRMSDGVGLFMGQLEEPHHLGELARLA
jgi:hypothetical protein